MRVGVVRGPFLNPWEMQVYEKINQYPEFEVEAVGCSLKFFETAGIRLKAHYPRVFSIPGGGRILGIKYVIPSLPKLAEKYDILHGAECYHFFSFQCARTGKKFVFTQWETISTLAIYHHPLARKIADYIIEKSDKAIAVSNKAKSCLEDLGMPSEKIVVQPMGIDTSKFGPDAGNLRKEFNIPEEDTVILLVGRLVKAKGVLDLVEAFKRIQAEHGNVKLILCGGGELGGRIAAERNPDIILTEKPYSEIPKLHATADMFCLPSVPNLPYWEEQFGYAIVEAMASGKPVVSTMSGAIPEIVSDNETGILVSPSSPVRLKEALSLLIEDAGLREKMGFRGREKAVREYDVKVVAENIVKVYRSL